MMSKADLKQIPIPSRRLPTRDVCARYGVVARTVDRWVETGVLPKPMRINRVRYWDLLELEEFDRARMSEASTNAA
jgi:predicted DNA-binding transcriptional regulator AlpA